MAAPGAAADFAFGRMLTAYRSAAGLTQVELARRAGVSVDAISLLERGGRRSPRSRTVRLLAAALDLSPRERDSFAATARRGRGLAALDVPPDLRLPSTPFVGRASEIDLVRALLAALRWSCELLEPGPRTLLRRLAVFAWSAPTDALERVGEAAGPLPGGALRHLAVLADHSLVQCNSLDGIEPRFTMLDCVQQYARELLAAAGEADATAEAHLEYYADLAVRAREGINGPSRDSWLERLGRDAPQPPSGARLGEGA